MANTPSSSMSPTITWGASLSAGLESHFPAAAFAVRAGIVEYDPTMLIRQLQDNTGDPVALALRSMMRIIDNTLEHTAGERNDAQDQLQLRQNELQACQSNLQKKSDLCDTLSTRLSSLLVHEAVPSYPKQRLSKDPPPFDGEEKEMKKRQQAYVNWKSQLKLCFAQDSAQFSSEKVKILHAVGLVRGEAYNNNSAIFDYMTSHPDDVACWTCTTSAALFTCLDRQYETLDLKLDAGIDFDQLFQRKIPFPNFIAKFETLAYQCGKTDEQRVDALKKKISQELAEKLATLENPPAANDYRSWVKKCRVFYDNIRVYEHNQLGKTGPSRPRIYDPSPRPSPQISSAGDPMELDRISLSRMSEEDCEYCRAHNLCFYCKGQGYGIDNCEKKADADSRSAGRGSRGNFFNYRGRVSSGTRGAYRGRGLAGQGQNSQQTQFQQFRPQSSYARPQPSRLRSLGHGFVEGELTPDFPSPTPLGSVSQGQSGNV